MEGRSLKASSSILWFGNWPGSPGVSWGKARKRGQGEAEREGEEGDLLSQGGLVLVPVRARTVGFFLE